MIEPIPYALRDLVAEETTAPVTTARAQAAVRAKLGATLGIAAIAATGAATASTAAASTAVASTAVASTTTVAASTVATSTVATSTVATTTVAAGTTAAVKTALSIKLVGVVLGVGAAGAVATTVAVTRDDSKPARPAIVERAPVERPSPPPPPRHSQVRVEPIEDVAPAPVVVDEPPPREPARRPTAKPAPVEPAAPVRSQSQLLADASRALSQGDAARALALIEEDTKHHGIGPLSEEREALRISVLSALGRSDDARQAARRLLATYPNTIHRRLAERALEAP
ncbi:MAG TPA: hypothetical protein VIV11_32545 [Kofleriaceae bacterium]